MRQMNQQPRKIAPAQWYVVALVLAFTVGSLLYTLLRHEQLGHSAAMFVGIPAVLAILIALAPKARTATGGILKGITLALLLLAPLLHEGFICILVASPLFYLVGIVVGVIVDRGRRRQPARLSCAALLLFPMCIEGVTPRLTFPRRQSVEAHRVVASSADLVERRLASSPSVDAPLPLALRLGFPRPLGAWGEGLAVGDTRTIHFTGAEGAPAGDLTLRVAERRSGYVRFITVSDGTKLSDWLRWTSSEVCWSRVDANHTVVTWRIGFERQLDPAWYFNAWERAAAKQAAAYLIEANATPTRRN